MNNNELDHLLKSQRVPEREPGFWQELPAQISRETQRRNRIPQTREARKIHFTFFIRGAVAAAVCIVAAFAISFWRGQNSQARLDRLAAISKYFTELESLFPNQLQAIVFEENGPRLVLSENADVPRSAPLFVKICDGNKCKSVLTFSGQEIRVNGKKYEVLLDHKGNVLLIGDQLAWSSADQHSSKSLRIEARPLAQL